MSDLTNELRDEANGALAFGEHGHAAMLNKVADRLDALEECLREFMAWADAPIGPHEQLAKVIDKARALLEGK